MQLFNQESPEITELEIYFKYYRLETELLMSLFYRLEKMYKSISEYTYPVYFSEQYNMPLRNFLEIDSIKTGESIKIKFKEGWKPEFGVKDRNLEIRIPLKLGIPLIILYLILQSAQKLTNLYTETLEIQLKELEIQVKELELQKIISQKSIKPLSYKYNRQSDDFVRYVINNSNINYFQINGLPIKDEK